VARQYPFDRIEAPEMTKIQLSIIFELWQVRYRENPEGFMSPEREAELSTYEYGDIAAAHFLTLADDLGFAVTR